MGLDNNVENVKEYLHSDELDEWDTVFDPPVKCEYSEEQLIRFAELWGHKVLTSTRDEFGNKLKQE